MLTVSHSVIRYPLSVIHYSSSSSNSSSIGYLILSFTLTLPSSHQLNNDQQIQGFVRKRKPSFIFISSPEAKRSKLNERIAEAVQVADLVAGRLVVVGVRRDEDKDDRKRKRVAKRTMLQSAPNSQIDL